MRSSNGAACAATSPASWSTGFRYPSSDCFDSGPRDDVVLRDQSKRIRPQSRCDEDLGIEISEAFQPEPESVPGRQFVLDAVRLDNVEQTLADHGDHEVPCRKEAQRPIGTPSLYRRSAVVNCQYVPPVYRHCDGRALSCSQASRCRQRSEESDLLGPRDTLLGKRARVDGGRESLLLIGIPVGYLVSDVIGDDELVGVPGNQIHPVDAQEIHQHRRIRHNHCRRRPSHETAHSARAASARRRRMSAFMPRVLLSSRTRPREISSRRYASIAR